FVMPTPAVFIGVAAGVICFFAATSLKKALGDDDSLDAFGVHCIGGIVGALLTGVFASTALDGGQAGSVLTQLKAVVAPIISGLVLSYAILKVIDMTIGLRVNEEEEREGLDVSLHGEHVEEGALPVSAASSCPAPIRFGMGPRTNGPWSASIKLARG